MMKQKKGQVTVFIILGLVIALVIGTVFYVVNQNDNIQTPEGDISKDTETVVSYVKTCLTEVTLEGARALGAGGGYIYLPQDNATKNLINPHANAIDVFGNGRAYVPYWFYKTENGIQKEQIPTMGEMERQLGKYVEENIGGCVTNFSNFMGYDISGFGEVKASVNIGDTNIVVNVDAPTTIKVRGVTQQVDSYNIDVNVGLGEAYDKAREIYDREVKDMFLEKRTMDMMVLYDDVPLSGSDIDCGIRVWSTDKVKTALKRIVETNIGAVRLNEKGLDTTGKYFNLGVDKDNFEASFMYSQSWPFYIDVQPSENGVMKSEVIGQDLGQKFMSSFLCINNYHFIYDVTYPVLINVKDDKGYMFEFGYVVVIDHNQEREDTLSTESINEGGPNICDKKNIALRVDVNGADFNGNTLGLMGADVYYKCISTRCYIGRTGADGSLTALFPQCVNGLVTGEKEGYFRGKSMMSTNVDGSASIMLEPVKIVNYEIKVIDEKTGAIGVLANDESVMLEMAYANDGDYELSQSYPEQKSVELITGKYNVKAYLMKNNAAGFTLQSQNIRKCVTVPKGGLLGLVGMTEEKCFDVSIDASQVDSLIVGGAEFEWNIEREELRDANRIVIYVMRSNIPKTAEEMGIIYDKMGSYKSNINFLTPDVLPSNVNAGGNGA